MGSQEKTFHRKAEKDLSATDLFSEIPSEARRQGRRLTLKFMSLDVPELDRIEFQANRDSKVIARQRGDLDDSTRSFKSSPASQALAIFFLDHLCARLKDPPKKFILEGGDGSQASSLGYALENCNGKWGSLFWEVSPKTKANRIPKVFDGRNLGGKPSKQRIIQIRPDYLPADCIEIFWNDQPLKGLAAIQRLTDLFRRTWKLPPPKELDLPEEKEPEQPNGQKKAAAEKPPTPDSPPQQQTPKSEPPPAAGKTAEPSKPETPKQEQAKPESAPPPKPPPPKIDPRLFEIQNPLGLEWHDSDPLINFGNDDSDADVWRIRDASEGLLIFGAIGSGKTSGSGYAVAQAFLQAGYGGLILTVKPDEAARWIRLCQQNGRAADCIHITPASGHRLNLLDYETQRPGERLSIADDLIELFRSVLAVSSGSKRSEKRDSFWTTAPNRLMGRLFDTFLLAQEPFTLDALIRFVECAPTSLVKPWQEIPYFAEVVTRAQENAAKGSEQDREDFQKAFHYWTQAFPAITDITRSGIITGFTAMADTLNGRGIKEIIGAETNITPEQILSGKIVILDFPVKEGARGGLMVQAAWRLLFQQAVERRADKGKLTARPVFLWEDEGHEFYSQNDVRFQPTARDVRAAHVILSQNIENFLSLGHNEHAVYAVFAAMNSCILHTNGDHRTNKWASERIGNVREKRMRTDGLFRGITAEDLSIWPRRPEDNKSIGHISFEKSDEPAVRPEDFSKLKRGGNGTCEALIVWLSHQFACNRGRNYCVRTFSQEPR